MNNLLKREKLFFLGIIWACLMVPLVAKVSIQIQLCVISSACVALGSLLSIKVDKKQNKRVEHESEDDDDVIGSQEALKMPIMATIALFGLYVVFKNVDTDFLNLIFKINFGILGTTSMAVILEEYVPLIFPFIKKVEIIDKNFDFGFIKQHIALNTHSLVSALFGGFVSFMYVYTNSWFYNNILGIFFTVTAIMFIKITDFKTALGLLWIFLVYDYLMVFKSDMMVTVASKFDVPIKLILVEGKKRSILGLGDMVFPGFLVALALKFDVDTAIELFNKSKDKAKKLTLKCSYFYATMIGYVVGIVTTFLAMSLMNLAQPALIYLIPTCTFGLLINCFIQGDFKRMMKYEAVQKKKPEDKKE